MNKITTNSNNYSIRSSSSSGLKRLSSTVSLVDRLTKLSIIYDPLSSRVNLDGFKQGELSKEEFKRQLTKVIWCLWWACDDDDDNDDHNNDINGNDDDNDDNDDDDIIQSFQIHKINNEEVDLIFQSIVKDNKQVIRSVPCD